MFEKKKITQISLGDGFAGSAKFAALKATLDMSQPEFVIAHHSMERKFLMRLRRQEGRKFSVIAFRNIVSRSFQVLSSIPYNLWLDLNVACGKGVARSLILRGILPRKVRVVYNGIEPYAGTIEPVPKSELGCDSDCRIIGMSAWFHPKRKGFDILFKALSKGLRVSYKILFLGIVDEHRQQVREMAKTYGIDSDKFIFPGYVENTWQYYRAMDLFVLPSREEGFSLSLLEAMICRLPCIASDVPGNNEAIQHDINGKLFSVHRPDQLRKAIIDLLSNSEKAVRFAGAARERVLNNFTIEKVTESFDRVLGELRKRNQ